MLEARGNLIFFSGFHFATALLRTSDDIHMLKEIMKSYSTTEIQMDEFSIETGVGAPLS